MKINVLQAVCKMQSFTVVSLASDLKGHRAVAGSAFVSW